MIELADYSRVDYGSVDVGYPPLPDTAAPSPATGAVNLEERRSPLPAPFVEEMAASVALHGGAAREHFADEPVDVTWPSPVSDQSYTVAGVPGRFRAGGTPRTLEQALPALGAPGEVPCDDLERLELVRVVGAYLRGLHVADLVTAGVGWSTIAFAREPRITIQPLYPDGVRRVGGEFLLGPVERRQPGVEEARCTSPFDADRWDFALLSRRLLLTLRPDGEADWEETAPITGLDTAQERALHRLWRRCDGPPGSRPQLGEWMAVLGA